MPSAWTYQLGARYIGNNTCHFRVWAPNAAQMDVKILTPHERFVPMKSDGNGYHEATVADVAPGSLYKYRIDSDKECPDPASRFQPQGVHGPSAVVDPAFDWQDDKWHGIPLAQYIVYELHVGTFTAAGTFEAIIPRLAELNDLGVTAIELLPVAQFPGARNWGYDGTYLFGVQNSYGGPNGLRKLVDACHQHEMAVVLDVVYNHLGPEGNYLWNYAPYFTDLYRTPWGEALNFDGPHNGEVRRFFIENALHWLDEYHIDGLRLDAIHAIRDFSAIPFLEELGIWAKRQSDAVNRRFYLIAESDLNDARVIRSRELGGYGLDAQWSDDFHHAAHTLLTGEQNGYYADFGDIDHLVRAYRNGFAYDGRFSKHRNRRHGNSSHAQPATQFVVSMQNHDQVGNRLTGDRFGTLLSLDGQKLAAALMLLSPYVPMLFMGEEYGEIAPFPYFVSHGDPQLIEAVRNGRKEEFKWFGWKGEIPDPQSEAVFESAKLQPLWKESGDEGTKHRILREWYQELIRLRKNHAVLASLSKEQLEVTGFEREKTLMVRRWSETGHILMLFHFGDGVKLEINWPAGQWEKVLDSTDVRWMGEGTAFPNSVDGGMIVSLEMAAKATVVYGT